VTEILRNPTPAARSLGTLIRDALVPSARGGKVTSIWGVIDLYRSLNPEAKDGKAQVFVGYTPGDNGRAGHGPYWYVERPGYRTSKTMSPHAGYRRTFPVYGVSDRQRALAEATEWCAQRYGYTCPWTRVPSRSGTVYAPVDLVEILDDAMKNSTIPPQ
jgi:hypothetical protein